jgi:hypothetical protein
MFHALSLPFKAHWEMYVPPALMINKSELCLQTVFRIIRRLNRAYFLKQI